MTDKGKKSNTVRLQNISLRAQGGGDPEGGH